MKTFLTTACALLLSLLGTQANADGLADPTRPPGATRRTTAEALQPLRVEAVLRSAERRLAIVNGKVVRTGDRVSGVLILEILDDGVRYLRDGRTQTVRLPSAAMQIRQVAEGSR